MFSPALLAELVIGKDGAKGNKRITKRESIVATNKEAEESIDEIIANEGSVASQIASCASQCLIIELTSLCPAYVVLEIKLISDIRSFALKK